MDIDVLIFGGQSNMEGQTECLPDPNETVANAWEYCLLTDELRPVRHPVGENIEPLLGAASYGFGSLAPDCCRTYVRATGRAVVMIHAAQGATTVAQWQKGTPRYEKAAEKLTAGIQKAATLGTVKNIYYVWLQGESDAIERTTGEDYAALLTAYKDDLKRDVGIHRFGIIQVGYFCGTVRWLVDRTREEGRLDDEVIQQAQEEVAARDRDFVMLTREAVPMSLDAQFINPQEDGHFNNRGLSVLGTLAGEALATL
ncbi:MAG: sialate O-acetylesterase [Ruminococcaceae bacterium]|nr:sialate O-acetylesterase [Oscillospiraceae bacterium]